VIARTVSGPDGGFRFPDVAAGAYEVRATLAGFRQTVVALTVGGNTRQPLTVKLLIGSIEEKVTISSEAPVIDFMAPVAPPTAVPTTTSDRVIRRADRGATSLQDPYPVLQYSTETYDGVEENKFRRPTDQPLSTFSIDVDTASYTNVRRFLNEGRLPPIDAVRVEELINYFHFDYPDSTNHAPFGVTTEIVPCPWDARHKLALVGLQARRIREDRTPPRNLVFLLDVSGSMQPADKLPLVKTAMKMLAETLTAQDRVAIVTYAGSTGVALPSTRGDRGSTIQDAISALSAGGSTNGGAGIQLAYQIAAENFVKGGINRVILATDGDFNVGVTSVDALTKLIEEKRATGVFLSVLGVGTGNLKDATMEKLADKGNGNYSYLDSLHEARRVLVAEAGSTMIAVAKDVKLQIEFNPETVGAYRLIGYENRRLKSRDFNDDTKDAGELGAGHSVTALYEIVPPGEEAGTPGVDPLKYQRPGNLPAAPVTTGSTELMTIKVRYKQPDGDRSSLVTVPVLARNTASPKHAGFAAAVAQFGMLLRNSPFKNDSTWSDVVKLATAHRGADRDGYRAEFIRLVELAAALDRQRTTATEARR
jgi:Ca-activated chloride channel homolog